MADKKEKRLRKILVKKGFKGQLKLVGSLEEAHLILLENKRCIHRSIFISPSKYRSLIEVEGYTFPEDQVYYLISTNPREVYNIESRFISNANGHTK